MKQARPSREVCGWRAGRRGATLVEVIWASLLLAVIAIAAGAFVALSSGMVAIARNQRTAIEFAHSRLEELRSAGFDAIKPTSQDYITYYLRRTPTGWQHSLTDPGEVIRMLGYDYPITTTVRYVDVDGGAPSYDVLEARVVVKYRRNEPNSVTLWAYFAP
ncbi:MAG: type II secretion system GspH family protein [Kiritimatiellae bacterium]|nr:type II secretion system GspH family protein [Kiritimatiellia bacterium]